jgi:hypothetical protein
MYKKALNTEDQRGIVNALMALGSAEVRKGNLLKSNEYYHKLIKAADRSNMASFGYGAMSNLAMNHRRLNRNDSAFYYFKKINTYFSENNYEMSANQARMNLGVSYFQYQVLDSAFYFLRLSLKGFKQLENQRFIAQNQSLLGEVYYQKENYTKAIELADSSLVISKDIAFTPNYAKNYSLLSRSYEKLGDSVKAEEYALLEERNMMKRPSNTAVGRLNEKYESEMRDRRQANLEKIDKDKKFFKSNFFLTVVACIVLVGISWMLFRRHKLSKLEVLELQKLVDEYTSKVNHNKPLTESQTNIVLKSKVVVDTKNIIYIKSDGHYIDYFVEGQSNPEVDRNSLAKVLVELPDGKFIRTHRSYIANVDRIKIINSTQLMLDTGEWIPLSRTYKPGLKDLLNKK